MNVIIIEDEIPAQQQILRLLGKHFPDFKVSAILDSVTSAVDFLSVENPDIILMDVELSDGRCFEIFNRVEVKSPVIITTAYEDYALPAFKAKCIDYLLKPILDADFVSSVRRCMDFCRLNVVTDSSAVKVDKPYKQRFTIKLGASIKVVDVGDIAYFYSKDKATFLVTDERKSYVMDCSLDSLEPLLDPESFCKLSRGCIASRRAISNISKHFNSRLKVTLIPDLIEPVLISRARVPFLLKWIEI